MLLHWFITFFGNLAGSLLVLGLVVGEGGIFALDPYKSEAMAFAEKKAVDPEWHMIFLRGIGANWLVCLACFLSCLGREFFSKVVAIWWPTFAFVCLGFDHVVANMFFIPIATYLGDPEITVGFNIWKSMIPALLGNTVGGGLMVGVIFWYLHLTGEPSVRIDGAPYEDDSNELVGHTAETQSPTRDESTSEDKKVVAEDMV